MKKPTLRQLITIIQKHLSDDLLKPEYLWRARPSRLAGHCYTASETAYFLLGGKKAGWKPMVIKHEGMTHWFLKHSSGKILDITRQQFITLPDYKKGKGCGFLTRKLSKRAKKLLRRIRRSQ
jgi:hypothetical protein